MCFSRFNTFYNIFSLHHNVTTEFNVTIDDVISDMVKCLSKLQKYFFQINIKYIKILFLFLSNINVNLLEFSHKMIKRVLAITITNNDIYQSTLRRHSYTGTKR